jgi:hypothetical protein
MSRRCSRLALALALSASGCTHHDVAERPIPRQAASPVVASLKPDGHYGPIGYRWPQGWKFASCPGLPPPRLRPAKAGCPSLRASDIGEYIFFQQRRMSATPPAGRDVRDIAGFPGLVQRTEYGGYVDFQVFIAGEAQIEILVHVRAGHEALVGQFLRQISRV